MLGRFSRVRLFATPGTAARRVPLSTGWILQARTLERAAIPFSRGSSCPRDGTCVFRLLHWQAGFLSLAPPGKPRRVGEEPLRRLWEALGRKVSGRWDRGGMGRQHPDLWG